MVCQNQGLMPVPTVTLPADHAPNASDARQAFFAMADEMRANAAQAGLSDAELTNLIDEAVAEARRDMTKEI